MGRVMDAGATLGAGGVLGTVWGTTEVAGAARGVTEVSEASDEEAAKGRAV
jgi:hypothetical protein